MEPSSQTSKPLRKRDAIPLALGRLLTVRKGPFRSKSGQSDGRRVGEDKSAHNSLGDLQGGGTLSSERHNASNVVRNSPRTDREKMDLWTRAEAELRSNDLSAYQDLLLLKASNNEDVAESSLRPDTISHLLNSDVAKIEMKLSPEKLKTRRSLLRAASCIASAKDLLKAPAMLDPTRASVVLMGVFTSLLSVSRSTIFR